MQESSVLESVLRRDRLLVITGLGIVIVLAWLYLLLGAGMDMTAGEMTRCRAAGCHGSHDHAGSRQRDGGAARYG